MSSPVRTSPRSGSHVPSPVFEPFTLPNGSVLQNRLVKAAMEENMAAPGQLPGKSLVRLFRRWSRAASG